MGLTWHKLNTKLLIGPKALYFTVYSVAYVIHFFRAEFFKTVLDFTQTEYGLISSAVAAVGCVFCIAWSYIADKLGLHLLILALLIGGSALVFECILPVAAIDDVAIKYATAAALFTVYGLMIAGLIPIAEFLVLRILSNMHGVSRLIHGRQSVWGAIAFGLMTLLVAILVSHEAVEMGIKVMFIIVPVISAVAVGTAYLVCPSDLKTYRNLRRGPRREHCTQTDEPQSDAQKQKKEEDDKQVYAVVYDERALSDSGKDIETGSEQTSQAGVSPSDEQTRTNDVSTSDKVEDNSASGDSSCQTSVEMLSTKSMKRSPTVRLMTDTAFLLILMVVFLQGIARGTMMTFQSMYLIEEVSLSMHQTAVISNVGIIMEIFTMFFCGWLLVKIGVAWLLIAAQVAVTVRCFTYVLIPPAPSSFLLILLVEVLQGFANSCTIIAAIKVTADCAPRGLEATTQAIYTATYMHLPVVLMGAVGACMSLPALFALVSWASLVALIIVFGVFMLHGDILTNL